MRDLVDQMGGGKGYPPRDDDDVEDIRYVGLELVQHYDTGSALLLSETGEEPKAVWIPRSQVRIQPHDKSVAGFKKDGQRVVLPIVTVTMPEWLAKRKGLI